MAKEIRTAEAVQPGEVAPDTDLRATVERLSNELARVTKLLGESTEGNETPQSKAHREWAAKSAQEKTKLVADREFPAEPGTRTFDCRLVSKDGKPTEHFPLQLPAHSVEEAQGRYRRIMGIKETSGTIVATVATAAAA